jgi:hypothetical protein
MLVEMDDIDGSPFLFEACKIVPNKTFWNGRYKGTITLSSDPNGGIYSSGPEKHDINLTYDQFRWAYVQAMKNGEPILDLKSSNLENIRNDYAQATRKGITQDRFPHRPG